MQATPARPHVLYAASEMTPRSKRADWPTLQAVYLQHLPNSVATAKSSCRITVTSRELRAHRASSSARIYAAQHRNQRNDSSARPTGLVSRVPGIFARRQSVRESRRPIGPTTPSDLRCLPTPIAWLANESIEWGFRPDVVHLNDWQTALAAALLRRRPDSPATVFSIHNLSYQGIFDHTTFTRLGLPASGSMSKLIRSRWRSWSGHRPF